MNNGFIKDSLAPDPIIEWETPIVTQEQRAAFGALREAPGLVVSYASQDDWNTAVSRQNELKV